MEQAFSLGNTLHIYLKNDKYEVCALHIVQCLRVQGGGVTKQIEAMAMIGAGTSLSSFFSSLSSRSSLSSLSSLSLLSSHFFFISFFSSPFDGAYLRSFCGNFLRRELQEFAVVEGAGRVGAGGAKQIEAMAVIGASQQTPDWYFHCKPTLLEESSKKWSLQSLHSFTV